MMVPRVCQTETEIDNKLEVNMKKKIINSKREANNVLWSNDSPYKQKVVKSKKCYKRKEKFKKGLDGPFALFA